ncbi:adenylosuccinate lyase family protein [Streptomyces sp. NPDC059718]
MERDQQPKDAPDTGLLSPVRAGVPIETLVDDEAWLQAMLDAESALARAQSRLGVVPENSARLITRMAVSNRFDLPGLARRSRNAANPVVALVTDLTALVRGLDSGAADYVHQGSTSQDIMDTAAMLIAERSLRQMLTDLGKAASALAGLAQTHRLTLIAGRTLTQHAVPTTFGLKAAGWLTLVLDAAERLERVRSELPAQLGGAAGTLAGYLEYAGQAKSTTVHNGDYAPRLIAAYAQELGLREPVMPWHTLRTPIADLAAALAFATGALGKLAIDVLTMSRTEIAEVAEPADPGRGISSAMPQKKNPVLAILIRSAAAQVPALASVLTHSLMAEDERSPGTWQAEWQPLRESLRLTGGAVAAAAELAEGLTPSAQKMRDNLGLSSGLIVSERIAARLSPHLGKAGAKDFVSRTATHAANTGTTFAEALLASAELKDRLDTRELNPLLAPENYLGAAAMIVDRALERYHHTQPGLG